MENGKWKVESGKWKVESKVGNGKSMISLEFLPRLEWLGMPLESLTFFFTNASPRHGGAYSSSANGSPDEKLQQCFQVRDRAERIRRWSDYSVFDGILPRCLIDSES